MDATTTPLAHPAFHAYRWAPSAAAAAVLLLTLIFVGLLLSLAAAEAHSKSLRRNLRTIEFQRVRLAETQEMVNIGGYEWDTRDRRQRWSDHLYRLLGREVSDPPTPGPEFFFHDSRAGAIVGVFELRQRGDDALAAVRPYDPALHRHRAAILEHAAHGVAGGGDIVARSAGIGTGTAMRCSSK